MTIETRILEIYDRFAPSQIHPFIGRAFLSADDQRLRVMVVGINAYVSKEDWVGKQPSWFASWFREQRDRFHKGVWRDVGDLAHALTSRGRVHDGKVVDGPDSLYVTNAIKAYMPEACGKRADQVVAADFARFRGAWREELAAMGDASVFPHIIAIVGAPFWPQACATFRLPHAERFSISDYQSVPGACRHFVNRIQRGYDGETTVLVRLRHPAARTRLGSPAWLMADPEFRELVASGKQS